MDQRIQWPKATWWTKAWNTYIGCEKVSPACDNCWACSWAKRFKQSFEPHDTPKPPPTSGIVFCGSLTDLFGDWVDTHIMGENIASCAINSKNRKATYLWLTKRPKRMVDALHYVGDRLANPEVWFENNYFGITAENQEWYEKRLEPFLESFPKWAKAWISAEPLLGHLGLMFQNPHIREKIHWVVVGCESGRNRRDCPIEYVEDIVRQCQEHNVKVFVKQLSIGGKCVNDITKFPKHLQIRQVPWATTEKGSAE